MSHAIDDLKHEHEAILVALDILEEADQRLLAEEPVALADLQGFVDFLKAFVDTCHHGKEEGLLFPALVEADPSLRAGAVGELLGEHSRGREAIAAMAAALQPEFQVPAFTEAVQGYAALLRAHILKENQTLFPQAEHLLSARQLKALAEAFEAHEELVMGPGQHALLHAQLQAWRAKYLG